MTFETDDSQVADVFASIKASAIYLQRSVRCTFGYSSTNVSPCGQASWSPDATHPRNATQRHLIGEIYLRKDLQPSAAIKSFFIDYTVAVFPPAAVGFKSASTGPLITESVKIVTRFPQGPRPRPSTPPESASNDPLVDRYYQSVSDVAPKLAANIKLWNGDDLFP